MTATPVQSPHVPLPLAVPQGAPSGFVAHVHETAFVLPHDRHRVWAWLNDPATFVHGQVWPWRVEFVGGGFEPGVLTAHHGPFLTLAGVVGEVDPLSYRDLRYFYGSYAFSLRLLRPMRLQFWLEDADFGGTRVRLRLDSLIRVWLSQPWTALQRLFWRRFGHWMEGALSR